MNRQFDELSILSVLEDFRFGDFVYGTVYNVTCIPFVLLGIICDNFTWSIIGGRLQSAFSMMLVALLFARISALFYSGRPLFALVFFPFIVPFFWVMGSLFHPDAMMTACIMACVYFLLKDAFRLGLNLQIACAFFALALGVKIHALMFAPLLPVYGLMAAIHRRNIHVWKSAISSVCTILVCYLLAEPRMLSLRYLLELIDIFAFQMWTNRTGFGVTSSASVSLHQKMATVQAFYSPGLLLAILFVAATGRFLFQARRGRFQMLPLYATNAIVIAYYAFLLNKDWAYYYISPYFTFVVMGVTQLAPRHSLRLSWLAVIAVIALQLCIPMQAWNRVIGDYYVPDQARLASLLKSNDAVVSVIEDFSDPTSARYTLTYGTPFDYDRLSIERKQIDYLATDQFRLISTGDYSFLHTEANRFLILSESSNNTNFGLLAHLRDHLESIGAQVSYQDKNVRVYLMRPARNDTDP